MPETACGDGVDNDDDVYTDCRDSDCFGVPPCTTETSCNDSSDNDADGLYDCLDTDCVGTRVCLPETNCTDGVDNDDDWNTDCADSDCNGLPPCDVESGHCGDWQDNDGDASSIAAIRTAWARRAASGIATTAWTTTLEHDGRHDCEDPNCFGTSACAREDTTHYTCADGADNDMDGVADCADPDCRTDNVVPPRVELRRRSKQRRRLAVDCADLGCWACRPATSRPSARTTMTTTSTG